MVPCDSPVKTGAGVCLDLLKKYSAPAPMAIRRRISPKEFSEVDDAPDPDSVSVVLAVLSVAPKSIWPIHVPARPPAIPARSGLRCHHDGDVAGDGCPIGLLAAVGGGAVDGLAVVDCSMGLAPLF